MRINPLPFQESGKMFVMSAKQFGMGCVVISDPNDIVADADIAFHTPDEAFGEVSGIPAEERFSQMLAELMKDRLGDQNAGHVAVAIMEIESAGAFSSERLVGIEEFFDKPSFGKVLDQEPEFVAVVGGEKALELIVVGVFSTSLDDLS